MIYVIINEYGDYADYTKDILCASSSKEKATLYLNDIQQLSDKCHKLYSEEIWKQSSDWFAANHPIYNASSNWETFDTNKQEFNEELLKNA